MGHFVVSAAVNVRVGKNIKQPAGKEYRSDTYIYRYIYWVGPLCSSSRSPTLSYSTSIIRPQCPRRGGMWYVFITIYHKDESFGRAKVMNEWMNVVCV